MEITSIKSEEAHVAALKELEQLWDKAEFGTPEGERFEMLSNLIHAYEREHFPIQSPDPAATILFREDQENSEK